MTDITVGPHRSMVPANCRPRLGLFRPIPEVLVTKMIRSRPPPEVPPEFAKDYEEACSIIKHSPKASAALSRRCLQHILREKTGVKQGTLHSEIRAAVDGNLFPSHIAELLDVPRQLGNFAAHPMKEPNTGIIVDIEPWEAEWCLEVIEALFDYCFVGPARNAERLDRLRQKRGGSGQEALPNPRCVPIMPALETHRYVQVGYFMCELDFVCKAIPATAVNDRFIDNLARLVRRLAARTPARQVPSRRECGYCERYISRLPRKNGG